MCVQLVHGRVSYGKTSQWLSNWRQFLKEVRVSCVSVFAAFLVQRPEEKILIEFWLLVFLSPGYGTRSEITFFHKVVCYSIKRHRDFQNSDLIILWTQIWTWCSAQETAVLKSKTFTQYSRRDFAVMRCEMFAQLHYKSSSAVTERQCFLRLVASGKIIKFNIPTH